jgi:hypothetical protein
MEERPESSAREAPTAGSTDRSDPGPDDAPNDAPNDAPDDAPNDAPNGAPNDAPNDAPDDAPNDAPRVTPELAFDEPVDEAPAPDDDPDVRALRRRDKAFVFRVVLRASVALLLGFWIFLQLTSTDVGACAAQGFGTVTQ